MPAPRTLLLRGHCRNAGCERSALRIPFCQHHHPLPPRSPSPSSVCEARRITVCVCVCSRIRPTTVDQHEMACVDKSITHTIGWSERANGQECESLAKTWQKSHSPCPCPVTKLMMMMMCPVTSAHTWPGSRANGVCV